MDTAGFDAQVLVLAATVNGELRLAPFPGAATVMSEVFVEDCTVMFSDT
jgi:hypothetical protein